MLRGMDHRRAIACGIWAALLYAAMNVVVPFFYPGYSFAAHTPSELSAIGAPTRTLWVALGAVYTLLTLVFAWGVVASAKGNRKLLVAGVAILVQGTLSAYWPPMQMRGEEMALTDRLHIAWAAATVLMFVTAMLAAATAFGSKFRNFTIVVLLVLVVSGTLTSMQGPNIAKDLPTPTIGVYERISIAAYFLWSIVFARESLKRLAVSHGVADGDR